MKIYTRTGDDGSTGMIGGGRVSKADPRMEAVGTVDELNAALGIAAVVAAPSIAGALRAVQEELFIIGAVLAAPNPPPASLPRLDPASITRLEGEIDVAESQLPALQNFILPGGSEAAGRLHVARAVCRRAERLLVSLSKSWPVTGAILTYLNRLSDWLFMQARLANHLANVPDVPWNSR